MSINHISSIPIGIYKNNDYTEHNYFYNLKYHDSDKFFSRSINSKVLENTELVKFINEKLKDYCVNALSTYQNLRITQSWCIKHHNRKSEIYNHTHTNSIVSGAYYIKCDSKSSPLILKSPSILSRSQIDWDKDSLLLKDQSWMWKNYEIFPQEGLLVLFPSNVEHSVSQSIDNDDRCVLSFNTWFEGNIGNENAMNLLEI